MKGGERGRGPVVLAILVFLLTAAGCTARAPAPAAEGISLYSYITKDNKYSNWKMWPGKQALYPGPEPHGKLLTTYVTDKAFSAIDGKKGSIPNGSIIVKENYMPDGKLDAITVMYKVKSFDPANNDWFWLKYAPDGAIDVQGKVDMCIACHGKVRDNDFIYTSSLK